MTKKSAAAVIDLAAPYSALAEFREIPLDQLRLSPLNPRKHFDETRTQELADSMGNGVGIIENLVVRPWRSDGLATDTTFEIVAGARRYKAAQIAGLVAAPCTIKTLTDAQVLELMLIENDQRADIRPLEEAAGFRQAMVFGFDIDALAKRIGHTRRYIYDRVQLLELVDEAKTLLDVGVITLGHAVLLSREKPADQFRAIKIDRSQNSYVRDAGPLFEREDTLFTPAEAEAHKAEKKANPYAGYKAKTVRELEVWINEHCRFDASTPVAGELFKTAALVAAEAPKVVAITYAHHTHPDAKAGLKNRIFSVVSWKRADGEQRSRICDHSVPGMVIAGAGRGDTFQVCVNKDKCLVHWAADVKRRAARKAATPAPAGTGGASKVSEDKKAAQRRAKDEADHKAREAAREIRAEAVRLALGQIVTEAATVSPAVIVRALHEIFCGDADAEGFCEFFGLPKNTVPHYGAGASKALLALSITQLERALIWAALSSELSGVRDDKLAAWFKEHKVNLTSIEQAVRDRRTPAAAKAGHPGVCRFCGCTEAKACPGGCSWLDEEQTVCSAKTCRAAWKREKATTKAADKKAAKKR